MPSHIRRLKIERFRGIESLIWYPSGTVNIILGGGDTGKTTILDAIALLLNPTNTYVLTDADYWKRDVGAEFVIEAVMALPEIAAISQQFKMNWPWEWDGNNPVLPAEDRSDDEQEQKTDPVYKLRVRGTSDLELAYEIIQPDGSIDGFSVGLRRDIGIVRLSGDDRNDRDLRLVQGSGLDRLLSDKGLRGRLAKEFASEDVKAHLKAEAQTMLSILEASFNERSLPSKLGLGITGGPGTSLNALVGLTANKDGVTLPLSNWGAGTRRLAALAIADALQRNRPITVVDEIEKGLEPYRLRTLITALKTGGAQVFITTHSATAISAGSDVAIWYLDARCQLGLLSDKIARHLKEDPETFLSRLSVVCEGATEVGFVSVLLSKAINGSLEDHGICITDGGGHDSTRKLLEALAEANLTFAGIVDNEGRGSGGWEKIKVRLGDLLLQWPDGCLEEHVIPLFEPEKLRYFFEDPEGDLTGMRLRSLVERIGINEKDFEKIKTHAGDKLIQTIIDAATGKIPEKYDTEKYDKKHFQGQASNWFKSEKGGRELAEKVFTLGAWPKLRTEVLKFLNAILQAIDLPPVEDLE
jgi:putative ATP-dependent endonuclease of OLD family